MVLLVKAASSRSWSLQMVPYCIKTSKCLKFLVGVPPTPSPNAPNKFNTSLRKLVCCMSASMNLGSFWSGYNMLVEVLLCWPCGIWLLQKYKPPHALLTPEKRLHINTLRKESYVRCKARRRLRERTYINHLLNLLRYIYHRLVNFIYTLDRVWYLDGSVTRVVGISGRQIECSKIGLAFYSMHLFLTLCEHVPLQNPLRELLLLLNLRCCTNLSLRYFYKAAWMSHIVALLCTFSEDMYSSPQQWNSSQ